MGQSSFRFKCRSIFKFLYAKFVSGQDGHIFGIMGSGLAKPDRNPTRLDPHIFHVIIFCPFIIFVCLTMSDSAVIPK